MIGVFIEAGFCNRVFKMIFAYVFAHQHQIPFRLEGWDKHSHHTKQVYEWLVKRIMESPYYHHEPITYTHQWIEPSDQFMNYLDVASLAPYTLTEPTWIHGFFQHEAYFKSMKSEVRRLLKEPEFITQKIEASYKSHLDLIQNAYFLHVRLGDYLHMDKHFVDLSKYYEDCLNQIAEKDPGAMMVLFSNQPKLISKVYPNLYTQLHQLGMNFMTISDSDETTSFYLMVRCSKGGICSNSTYGWWAGWLNENSEKRLFMPSKWINMEGIQACYYEGVTVVEV